jgi:hypothetical protein
VLIAPLPSDRLVLHVVDPAANSEPMPLQRRSGIVTAQRIAVKNQAVKLRDGECARFRKLIHTGWGCASS